VVVLVLLLLLLRILAAPGRAMPLRQLRRLLRRRAPGLLP
jgi:hypothetical protein